MTKAEARRIIDSMSIPAAQADAARRTIRRAITMKSTLAEDQEIIRQMVRGEIPWTQLKVIGISVALEDGRCHIENPKGIVAKADVHDLAKGLLSYLQHPGKLREWAYLMEAGSTILDLDVEDHPAGEPLMQALWKASFGEPISEDEKKMAEQLA
jgi:hypothetical protein